MPQDPILSVSQREKRIGIPLYSLHLDLIRGLAALLVLGGHLRLIVAGQSGVAAAGQTPTFTMHPAGATGFGHAAVVVFFVLSGYLVGGSVIRDLGRNSFSWIKYGLRRLARLWTVLIPTLLIGAVLDALSTHFFAATRVVAEGEFTRNFQMPGFTAFFDYLGFLQSINRLKIHNFGTNVALWSLSNEFWYYVLFPLLAVAFAGKASPRLLRLAFFLIAAFLLWFLGAGITGYFPLWLCGVLAYVAPAKIPARFQSPATAVLALQFFAVLFMIRFHPMESLEADSIIAVSFTLMLYAILHQVGPASASFYSRLAHAMSFPSYSLYATHIPICILISAFLEAVFPQLFRHSILACAAVFALVLAYSGIFYLIFERNTDRIRRFAEAHLLRLPVASRTS